MPAGMLASGKGKLKTYSGSRSIIWMSPSLSIALMRDWTNEARLALKRNLSTNACMCFFFASIDSACLAWFFSFCTGADPTVTAAMAQTASEMLLEGKPCHTCRYNLIAL